MENQQQQDDHEDDEQDLPVLEDDLAAPETESTEGRLRETQFGLLGLFGLVTVLGVYFALERLHHGQFALHAAGAVALIVGVVIPAAGLVFWLLLAWFDRVSITKTLLAVVTLAAVVLGIKQFWD